MAAPTGLAVESGTVGIREDLENDIWRVAAEENPFINNIGKKDVDGTFHEWQIEDLAAPDEDNAQLDGDDVGDLDAPHATERIGVYAQIFRKTGGVSRSTEKSNRAGRESTLDEQKMIKGLEMKRDMEKRFIGNYASQAQSGSNPRKTAGACAWIEDASSKGNTGTDGGWQNSGVVSAAGSGDDRAFSEPQVKALLATAFSYGARMKQGYLTPGNKQDFSAFSGIAEKRYQQSQARQAKIIGAADVYVSDFGNITLIPHPYGLGDSASALFIDPDGWAVGTYDGVKTEPLAKTGDSTKFIMTCEKMLICKNQRKGAVVRDLL